MKIKLILRLFCIILILTFALSADAATRIVYENFDDEEITSPLSFVPFDPSATYNFVTGYGGTGKAFNHSVVNGEPDGTIRWTSSGSWTYSSIYLRWRMRYSAHSHTGTGIWNDKWVYFYPQLPSSSPHSATDYYGGSEGTWVSTGGLNYSGVRVTAGFGTPPNDGQWHQYAIYYHFASGTFRIWMDGVLKKTYISEKVQDWVMPNQVRIYCPSIVAGGNNSFTRQIDDWELWTDIPGSEGDINAPYVASPSPADEATEVATDTEIEFRMTDSAGNLPSLLVDHDDFSFSLSNGGSTTYYGDSDDVLVEGTTSNYLVTLSGLDLDEGTEYTVTINCTDTENNAMPAYSFSFTTITTSTDPQFSITSHTNGELSGTQAATISGTMVDGTVTGMTWTCPECTTTSGSATLDQGADTWTFNVTLPSTEYGTEGLSDTDFTSTSALTPWQMDGGWSYDESNNRVNSTGGGGGGGSTVWGDYNNTAAEATSVTISTDHARGQRIAITEGFVLDKIVFQATNLVGDPRWTCRISRGGNGSDLTSAYDEEWTDIDVVNGSNTLQSGYPSYTLDDGKLYFACLETGGSGAADLSYSSNTITASNSKEIYNTTGSVWSLNYADVNNDLRAVFYKTDQTYAGSLYQTPLNLQLYQRRYACITVDAGSSGTLDITPLSYLGPDVIQSVSVSAGEHCYDLLVTDINSPLRLNSDFVGNITNISDKPKGARAVITVTATDAEADTQVKTLYLNYFSETTDTQEPNVFEVHPLDEDINIDRETDISFLVVDDANLSMSNHSLFNFTFNGSTYYCDSANVTCDELTAGQDYIVTLTGNTLLNDNLYNIVVNVEDTAGNSSQTTISFMTLINKIRSSGSVWFNQVRTP